MTNKQRIEQWHRDPPDWARCFTARDWATAEEVAEQLDAETAPENVSCTKSGDPEEDGHYCTLQAGHDGPCHTVAL